MNKIFLTGHLGADPAVREATNQEKYCHFSMATDEYWRDAAGVRQKRTEWHSVFFWGATGETLARSLRKGSKLLVEGRLESRPDPEPGASARRIWSVKGLHYELLDRAPPATGAQEPAAADAPDDDVPL